MQNGMTGADEFCPLFRFRYVKKPSHPSLLSIPVAPAVSDEKCGSFSDAKELFRSHSSVRPFFVRDEDDDEVIFAGERDGERRRDF